MPIITSILLAAIVALLLGFALLLLHWLTVNRFFITWFRHSDLTSSLVAFVLIGSLIIWLDIRYGIEWADVRVEMHGLLLDIFVFGGLILLINKSSEKAKLMARYHEEIEDFRDWKSDESKCRILGNIKRLSRLGETKFDLNRCSLKEVHLVGFTFKDSDFNCVDLSNAYISECTFTNVNFSGAKFMHAMIRCSSFINCNIDSANFHDSILYKMNFSGSEPIIWDCNLQNSICNAHILYEPLNLPENILEKIRREKPDLLEEPTFAKMNRFESKQ